MIIITTRKKNTKNFALIFIVAALVLSVSLFVMTKYIYKSAEEDGFENLHLHTKQLKDDIVLQSVSDQENITTMAQLATKLYESGEGYELLVKSFKPIGLIEEVEILYPDNSLLTKDGLIEDFSLYLDFEYEKAKGVYISEIKNHATNPESEIVRMGVPIKSGGRTIAMLYGVAPLKKFYQKYTSLAHEVDAHLYVFEIDSGRVILNTENNDFVNMLSLENREYYDGYSYDEMYKNIKSGNPGYTSFYSPFAKERLYLHYAPMAIDNWEILVARPSRLIFGTAHRTQRIMYLMGLIILLVALGCFIPVFFVDRRRSVIQISSSRIRKLLLDINKNDSHIKDALAKIAARTKARSAFYADTDGNEYGYMPQGIKSTFFDGDNANFVFKQFMNIAASKQGDEAVTLRIISVLANNELKNENPKLYEFFKENNIQSVYFSALYDESNRVSIIVVTNPKKIQLLKGLLEEISVCFSISIFNKSHLSKTEYSAVTDSLTGLYNRVKYKSDIEVFNREQPRNFACIYIDANGLHILNNIHGHAAGDNMLIYVANSLKEAFFGSNIYRMGGDEFLVFVKNTSPEEVDKNLSNFLELLKIKNYSVSVGVNFQTQNIDTEETVRQAEKRMYTAKARHYQEQTEETIINSTKRGYYHVATGNSGIDTALSVIGQRYSGIYFVDLAKDHSERIITPDDKKNMMSGDGFSDGFKKYVDDYVNPDFHRAILSFLDYDSLKGQLKEGKIPKFTYQKKDGSSYTLSVHPMEDNKNRENETLWLFECI